MIEKRQHPRKQIAIPLRFAAIGLAAVEATCTDVALGGMFVETEAPLAYGTRLVIHVRLPGLKEDSTLDAVVRWVKPSGMGVQFGVMGARETHALMQLLA